MKATFTKKEKLCKQNDFTLLFTKGKSINHNSLKIYFLFFPSDIPEIKVAFSVSSKKIKRAVERNYIKRLFRETYRKNKQLLHEILTTHSIFITFVYTTNEKITYQQLEKEMIIVLKKIRDLYNIQVAYDKNTI